MIFFAGLALLVAATVAITIWVSNLSRASGETIARLGRLAAAADAWAASLAEGGSPAQAAPSEIERGVRVLIEGGELALAGWPAQQVPPADDAELVSALERILALLARSASVGAPTVQSAALRAELRGAFDQALLVAHLRQASDDGMVRGMYAALLLSSLIFLLVGLWFTQQIVVAPLEALDRVARRVAAGDLDTPVVLGGQAELSELARSFETMRLELRRSRERLTRWTSDLEAHVARRTQQLLALSQVTAAASRSLELDALLRAGLEQALQAVSVEMGGIWLVEEETSDLRLAASQGLPQRLVAKVQRFEAGQGATGRASQTGQTIVLEDISQAPGVVTEAALQEGLRGLVAAPIKLREHVLGVLDVMTRQQRSFTPEEIALLASIGQQIGIAVDSLRLAQEVGHQAERVAALQERERIAIELHDGLLQTLGYLYLKADQLEATAAERGFADMAQELVSYRAVLENASRDARRFIADLREAEPPPIVLETALQATVAEVRQLHGVQVALDIAGPPIVLDADRGAHVVRIAREALINAARHGRAQRVTLACRQGHGQGQLCVEDDGAGFAAAQLAGNGGEHFGLRVMQARAARIGGALQIDSLPGQGTRICVTWPLAPSSTR